MVKKLEEYDILQRVPLVDVREDDDIKGEPTLGEDASVIVSRSLTVREIMASAEKGEIVIPGGKSMRISHDKVLRQCASGQAHVEISLEY